MATLGWIRAAGDDVGPDEALQAPSAAADNDASRIRDRVRLDRIAVIGRVLLLSGSVAQERDRRGDPVHGQLGPLVELAGRRLSSAAVNSENTTSSTGMRIEPTCSTRVPSSAIARAAASSRGMAARSASTSTPGQYRSTRYVVRPAGSEGRSMT